MTFSIEFDVLPSEKGTHEVHEETLGFEFIPEEEKSLLRRIDIRLVITLGILYMCSMIDKTNLGIANISG